MDYILKKVMDDVHVCKLGKLEPQGLNKSGGTLVKLFHKDF